jgi:hypothetical protein
MWINHLIQTFPRDIGASVKYGLWQSLVVVLFDLVVHHCYLYTCLLEQFKSILICMIPLVTNDASNSSIYYHHCACPAWRHLAVKRGSVQRNAESGSLDDCVLFCMECTDAMLSNVAVIVKDSSHVMTNLVAVWQTGWRANVTCCHDTFAFDNHASVSSTVACSTLRDGFT